MGTMRAGMDGWTGTHLGDDLELLALADLGLGDGLLETVDGLVVELLNQTTLACYSIPRPNPIRPSQVYEANEPHLHLPGVMSYLSTGDVQFNLATVSTHQSRELLGDALEQTETVVLGQSLEEVLDDVALVAGELLQLLDDLLLVADGEGGRGDDAGQLAVGLEGLTESGEGLGGRVESGSLGRGSVLD